LRDDLSNGEILQNITHDDTGDNLNIYGNVNLNLNPLYKATYKINSNVEADGNYGCIFDCFVGGNKIWMSISLKPLIFNDANLSVAPLSTTATIKFDSNVVYWVCDIDGSDCGSRSSASSGSLETINCPSNTNGCIRNIT
jgi:hypothetical protein